MEQLGVFGGHMTKFGALLRLRDRKFVQSFKFINIDEIHTIGTCGIPKYGQAAFRPAYGRFETYRMLFSKETIVIGYSATMPPHILRLIEQKIGISTDHSLLKRSSNRPNIMYATHQIIGSLTDYRNLSMFIPPPELCLTPKSIPSTIIFHDDIQGATNAALFMNTSLPSGMRGSGLVRHYHSLMSREYLEKTYQDFQNGTCRVIHTCAGMESGIDFIRADIVCQYGIPSDGTRLIQRGGRGGRNPEDRSLFLIMYEPWVKDLDLTTVPPAELEDDPDRPFTLSSSKRQPKSERTGCFCIHVVQSTSCIRSTFARYLDDPSPEGLVSHIPHKLY
jgi:superfamily II DNA helicase RecQ